jgi:ABC-type amino acid transport substrate-binding protein
MNLKALALCAALAALAGPASAQSPTWTQTGMLTCKLNPSIGFIIAGHQSMECRFVPSAPGPQQFYEGALNTVGIDIGVVGGGALAWGVLAPTAGVPAGALAGTYVGASGDVALGLGVGANVLVGGSNRSFALQPLSVQGSVALDVTLGLSALQLRWVP